VGSDKRKKRRTLPPGELRTDYLEMFDADLVDRFTIALLLFAYRFPPHERMKRMAEGLSQIIHVLHLEGYAAPLWLTRPAERFQELVTMDEEQAEEELARAVLRFVEGMLKGIDERARLGSRRALLAFFVDLYETNEVPVPPWLYRALEEAGGRPTPPTPH
jgi:hypothetical protein